MTWIDTHATDAVQRWHLLFQFDFTSPVRWTDCPTPIYWNSQTWAPKPTKMSGITTRQLDFSGASFEVGNAANLLSAIVFAGVQGVIATVWTAHFDPETNKSAIPDDVVKQFTGAVTIPRASNNAGQCVVAFSLGPRRDLSTKFWPTRKTIDLLRV